MNFHTIGCEGRMNTRLLTKAEMKESVHIVRDGRDKRRIRQGCWGYPVGHGLRNLGRDGGRDAPATAGRMPALRSSLVLAFSLIDGSSVRPIACGAALSWL